MKKRNISVISIIALAIICGIVSSCRTVTTTVGEGMTEISGREGNASERKLGNLVIAEGVTKIGDRAFYNCNLVSVTLPSTLKEIGVRAFSNNKLTNVIIPEEVRIIGGGAFSNNRLTNVTIPEGVTVISSYAFQENRLTSVIIPPNVVEIERSAFSDNLLTSIIIPESVERIGEYAFADNPMSSLTILGPKALGGEGIFGIIPIKSPLKTLDIQSEYTRFDAWEATNGIGGTFNSAVGRNTKITIGSKPVDYNQFLKMGEEYHKARTDALAIHTPAEEALWATLDVELTPHHIAGSEDNVRILSVTDQDGNEVPYVTRDTLYKDQQSVVDLTVWMRDWKGRIRAGTYKIKASAMANDKTYEMEITHTFQSGKKYTLNVDRDSVGDSFGLSQEQMDLINKQQEHMESIYTQDENVADRRLLNVLESTFGMRLYINEVR